MKWELCWVEAGKKLKIEKDFSSIRVPHQGGSLNGITVEITYKFKHFNYKLKNEKSLF